MFCSKDAQRAERTLLPREQGVASSNLVIPTSIYKERPSRDRSFLLASGPILVRSDHLIDNLIVQGFSVGVFRGGVLTPGQVRSFGERSYRSEFIRHHKPRVAKPSG